MKISIQSFQGIAPKVNPRYLPDGGAQVALNVEATGRSLKPLKGLGAAIGSSLFASPSGAIRTIYKAGQDVADTDKWWLRWLTDVDVCRSQIAGDTAEWTFWTGQTYPRMATLAMMQQDLTGNNSRRLGLPAPTGKLTLSGAVAPTPDTKAAELTLTALQLATMTTAYGIKVSVDNGTTVTACTLANQPPSAAQAVTAINTGASAIVTASQDGDAVKLVSVDKGASVKLWVRWGEGSGQVASAAGTATDLGTQETRVYVYTWVGVQDGLAIESAPSLPLEDVGAYAGSTIYLSRSETAPNSGGYQTTHWRIYRATAGTYLFVTELAHNVTTYTDTKDADALGEALPSLNWEEPPTRGSGEGIKYLQGLINLPNGMMAGFIGREIFFAEPYRPYAWPSDYAQILDYPIVGLGRMDTTLVALTTGVPYFLQGSSPGYVTVVKSDIEQACVSKRSIVSLGGAVLYASPDGLAMLSSNGSKILTEAILSRDDWQALNPSSLHAYGHDGKYIACHDKATLGGVDYYGFVLDLASGSFMRHNLSTIAAGFSDLVSDTLYLADTSDQLRSWGGGSALLGKWRSKIFTLPQITGFSCAQVEAEAYDANLKCRIYRADPGARAEHLTSLTGNVLTSRAPFRLEAQQGRDWEIELEVSQEIFNLAIAQSMTEIATA